MVNALQRRTAVVLQKSIREGFGLKRSVRQKFLMTRYLEQYLDLFAAFETIYRLRQRGATAATGK